MSYIVQASKPDEKIDAFVCVDGSFIAPQDQLFHTFRPDKASRYDTQEAAQSVAYTAGKLRPSFTYTVREA